MTDAAPITAYIGLGSNLDNPHTQITRAFDALAVLPDSKLVARSPLYRSRAVGPPQPDYINAVAALHTRLPALALLDALQGIEQAHRRVRKQHWGPRTLDLDLLLYGEHTLDLPRLSVPHPYLSERNFVLYPLADIAPTLVLPDGRSLAALLEHCDRDGLVPVNETELTTGAVSGTHL
ncbi:2-amino-4-hydroxy-6-hydroxymethyldihydropteridine diphosphokinase [Marinimicrobium alkaliphilum]|uniref:2-amino-4-hydroxy-6- hydroxymethyldihydropteridine diphosphokinase n=1 Tax=Marinimicrobium alkaliphilum TaxID=2202654 RepID=UPI000DB9A88B|nr:2-amino-4-hydroxy-6-hydroxymethyldihydropteridine diphosphokinase [Marinimicrobium alkaliphilum]